MAVAASPELEDLLARVALGDRAAFRRLYERTSAALFGAALRLCRRRDQAEEVLQDAFVNVWHHAASYTAAKSQPLTWLTSVVRNRCLDLLRRRELDTVSLARDEDDDAEFDVPADTPSPSEMLLAGADALAVRDCVDQLEGGPKQAIALAFFQGLSHGELAEHLRQPLGTVKSWIRRALERLKHCLDRSGYLQ
jgi:RNA polymerase sigma-70 factor (ECF subfamily)